MLSIATCHEGFHCWVKTTYLFVEVITTKKVVAFCVAKFMLLEDPEPFIKFVVSDPSTYLSTSSELVKLGL